MTSNQLGLRLSATTINIEYAKYVDRIYQGSDGAMTRLTPVARNTDASMVGGGLGANLRLSKLELIADFAVGGAPSLAFMQYRVMLGVPILLNSSWELRPRVGYRGLTVGVGQALGGYAMERSGLGVECEFAMPLNSLINFVVSAGGTILKGSQISDIQPGIVLGLELLLPGNTPYREEPRIPQIALQKLEDRVSGFLGYFPDRTLGGRDLDVHLTLLMAAAKKMNQYRDSDIAKALDAIEPMASYVMHHSDNEMNRQSAAALFFSIKELPLESAMKLAGEISGDKTGVMRTIRRLRKNDRNNYHYLVALYRRAVEDLMEAHPQTTLTLDEVKRLLNEGANP